jgi:hypothetical protein
VLAFGLVLSTIELRGTWLQDGLTDSILHCMQRALQAAAWLCKAPCGAGFDWMDGAAWCQASAGLGCRSYGVVAGAAAHDLASVVDGGDAGCSSGVLMPCGPRSTVLALPHWQGA